MPFIDELLVNINSIICDLQPQQVRHGTYSSCKSRSVCSVTKLGDLSDFGHFFKAFGNN